MNTRYGSGKRWLYLAFFASGMLGLGSIAGAAAESLPAATNPEVESAKPIPPGKAELVDSAFKKLALGKDYVSRDDAMSLDNFMPVFDAADLNHDDKLNFAEFKKAWTAYTAADAINRG